MRFFDKTDVWQGTLALMVLKTLEALGPLHGYGIARRIEQTSEAQLVVNYGTLYPALLKLEQEGYISSEWEMSDNNRKAKSDWVDTTLLDAWLRIFLFAE